MIITLDKPCWRLVDQNGDDHTNNDDTTTHHDSEAEAIQYASEGKPAGFAAKQYAAPCLTVSCTGCAEEYEDPDTYGTVHFPDLDTVLGALDGWKVGPGNEARCPDCAAMPTDGPPPIVPVPGQLAMPV